MNVLTLSPCGAPPVAADGAPEIARLDAAVRLEDTAAAWEELLAADTFATPFASRGWIAAWQRHVGAPHGHEPLLVVARDARDAPLLLLPFCVRRGRLAVARWFGGTHSLLNMGLWRRDVAQAMTAERLHALLGAVAAQTGIDVFLLRNQPLAWDGSRNPFALLPHMRACDDVYRHDFAGTTAEEVIRACLKPDMRGRLKTKERKLERLDGYRYFRAATEQEVDRVLDAFFMQKAVQFAARGIRDVFSAPGTDAFLREACRSGLSDGRPAIELHALEGGGEVIAIMGGVAGRRRFSAMFNSYTLSENGRWSPGLIIVTHVIRSCAERGLNSFDLGVGYAEYKRFFCKQVDALFESHLAFTPKGRAAALAARAALAFKRAAKATPPLWDAMQRIRRAVG